MNRLSALLILGFIAPPFSAVAQSAPPVVSEIVTSAATSFRRFPGVIRATREVSLAFLATGRVESRKVALGDRVVAQQVIATLDQTSLAEDAAAARAAEASAKAQAEIAAQALARAEALYAKGIAPMSQLEAARAAMATAGAAAEAARASVTRAEDAASYARLTAPEAGVIIAVHSDPGATVQSGQPIATLALLQGREAVIDVPASYLPLFTMGAEVRVTPRGSAHSDDTAALKGHVRLIEPVADSGARLHRLRIALDESELRLGALVEVQLEGSSDRLLTLPKAALLPDGSAATVWRITPDRRLEAVSVETGPEIDGRVIIRSGLSEGDEVLIRGIHTATEGATVGPRSAQ